MHGLYLIFPSLPEIFEVCGEKSNHSHSGTGSNRLAAERAAWVALRTTHFDVTLIRRSLC